MIAPADSGFTEMLDFIEARAVEDRLGLCPTCPRTVHLPEAGEAAIDWVHHVRDAPYTPRRLARTAWIARLHHQHVDHQPSWDRVVAAVLADRSRVRTTLATPRDQAYKSREDCGHEARPDRRGPIMAGNPSKTLLKAGQRSIGTAIAAGLLTGGLGWFLADDPRDCSRKKGEARSECRAYNRQVEDDKEDALWIAAGNILIVLLGRGAAEGLIDYRRQVNGARTEADVQLNDGEDGPADDGEQP